MKTSDSGRVHLMRLSITASALAGSLLAYDAALAQSTGSQVVEEVVVVAKKQLDISGVVAAQEAPKTREVITQQYFQTQPPGQGVLQDLNLAPGVNFTNDDPFGMSGSGGHLRIRGFDGAHVSLLVDGVPVNDTGNYAIYGGELLDQEVISQANVNLGSTDVDSPTASATGGLININSLKPTRDFNGFIVASGGSFNYGRIAGLLNTGEFGPFGTRAWIEGSYQKYDKFKGYGKFDKKQFNFKIYQDLHHEGDFVAVAGFWDDQFIPNIYGLNFATTGSKATLADPWNTDYLKTYYSAGKTPGVAGNDGAGNCSGFNASQVGGPALGSPAAPAIPATAACQGSNYYGNQVNPTKTGDIRAESMFTLSSNLHLTFDPSLQYVLADGGSQARTINETDGRLIGTATTTSLSNVAACKNGAGVITGLDLNGDGDCLDTVRVFLPSLTQTLRYTVNTSLIWDIDAQNLVRVSYAYDHGTHRQTGEATFLNASGAPLNPYGGKDGEGPKIYNADGAPLEYRNRLSIAELQQFSAEYVGRFFDNRLRADLGVRDPHFTRNLTNYCYTQVSNGSTAFCDSANPGAAYAPPFTATKHYTKVLPNAGLSWRFDAADMVYASYTQQLSAPKTDDLYTVKSTLNTVNIDNVQPETTTNYEIGYRYQASRLMASVALWDTEYQNRIITSYDPTTNLSQDRNVGAVQLYGVDAQIGAQPIKGLSLIGSLSYAHSRLKDNIVGDSAGDIEPLKGKQQVETPDWTVSGRASYEIADFVLGLQGKYVGKRYVTDLNDLAAPSYVTFDADLRYKLDRILARSYIQLNVVNLFDKRYLGSLNSKPTDNTDSKFYSGAPFASQGAPRTVWVSVRAAF